MQGLRSVGAYEPNMDAYFGWVAQKGFLKRAAVVSARQIGLSGDCRLGGVMCCHRDCHIDCGGAHQRDGLALFIS